MSKARGGLYGWRVNKPHALIGLPLIGRRWGYVGMTNSYSARSSQHLYGSVTYGQPPASWADLRPRCYRILPLPAFITHGKYRRRIMKGLETVAIGILCPTYNVQQQAPWNLRRVSKRRALADRELRDSLGLSLRLMRSVVRLLFFAFLLAAFVMYWGVIR